MMFEPRQHPGLEEEHLEELDKALRVLKPRGDQGLFHKFPRRLLTLDGGGLHIIWTLQLLKAFMRRCGEILGFRVVPCQVFDLIAGSSAGAFTAALLAQGLSPEECEEFWIQESPGLFTYANPLAGGIIDLLQNCGSLQAAQTIRNLISNMVPPLYDKSYFRELLRRQFGEETTLGELAAYNETGILLMTLDVKSGFARNLGAFFKKSQQVVRGPYANILARAAVEAAGSPPMLFQPMGRLMDAGFGSFNAPQALAIQALNHALKEKPLGPLKSFRAVDDASRGHVSVQEEYEDKGEYEDENDSFFDSAYSHRFGSIASDKIFYKFVMSFGTGFYPNLLLTPEMAVNPPAPAGTFWQSWLLNGFGLNAPILSGGLLEDDRVTPYIDFRRYDMAFSTDVLRKQLPDLPFEAIPGIRARSLHEVSSPEMQMLQFGMVPAYIPFYRTLGQAVVRYIERFQPRPFNDGLRGALNNIPGDVPEIIEQMSDPVWVDSRPTGIILAPPGPPVFRAIEELY